MPGTTRCADRAAAERALREDQRVFDAVVQTQRFLAREWVPAADEREHRLLHPRDDDDLRIDMADDRGVRVLASRRRRSLLGRGRLSGHEDASAGLEPALKALCGEAERAVRGGINIIILSYRNAGSDRIPTS